MDVVVVIDLIVTIATGLGLVVLAVAAIVCLFLGVVAVAAIVPQWERPYLDPPTAAELADRNHPITGATIIDVIEAAEAETEAAWRGRLG